MTEKSDQLSSTFRCGYVAIIGEPNVGKSTLMNTLLGQKVSIVTPKPQTTRHKVLGILSAGDYQMVFLDTPGLITPKYLLHEKMMHVAAAAIEDADVLLLMIDAASNKGAGELLAESSFHKLRSIIKPLFLVINKVDLVEKNNLLPVMEAYSKAFSFKEIFPISALNGDNTPALLKGVVQCLPIHPPFYPLDIVSERSERFFVGEIIREKIFMVCHEEVPYSTTVDVVEFKDREEGKSFISADIYVEKDSQKGILIGKQGRTLKKVGQMARQDIERFLERPVFLELHVKVRKWREDDAWLTRLGYAE